MTDRLGRVTDRLVGCLLVLSGAVIVVSAFSWEIRFLGDPVGPRPFPVLAGAMVALCGAVIALRPEAGPSWPRGRSLMLVAAAVLALLCYGLALRPLGFLASTAIVLCLGAAAFGASAKRAAATAVIGAVLIWTLIDRVLNIPLPRGPFG